VRPYTQSASVRCASDVTQALAQHERLVRWVVRRQWLGDLSYAEALHVGRIALWQALVHYDPGRGTAFSTYAVPAIAHAIWRAVAQEQAHAPEQPTAHLPQTSTSPGASPEAMLEDHADRLLACHLLHRLVAQLPHPLRSVIVARYGLTGDPPQTFTAIGQALGVSRQRAHQLHAEAILWLAHPAHSLDLRRCLDCNSVADYRAYLARLRSWLRVRRRIR